MVLFRLGLASAALVSCIAVSSSISLAADVDQQLKAPPVPAIPFFKVNDNRLSYSYQFQSTDAAYYRTFPNGTFDGKERTQTISLTHFDAWEYGTNFANVNFTKAGKNDPASPCVQPGKLISGAPADCAGAVSAFGMLRSTFGFNEVFNTKAFSWGPLRNVSLVVGGDIGVQNAYFASQTRRFVTGLQFMFDLPYKGYFSVSPLFDSEANHNAFTECGAYLAGALCHPDGNVNFKPTWMLEAQYYMDLGFLPESVRYFAISGRVTLIGPKGPAKGLSNLPDLTTEVIAEPIRLTFDAGSAFWGPRWAHELDLWAAWRIGQNQYGNEANGGAPFLCNVNGVSNGSCSYSSAVLGVTAKF